jgi:hypothetical protein
MKELLDKIASYNLFNYLLPGVLFVVLANWITNYSFPQDNLILGAFVCYFIGLVISRIGSLLIEPFLKKISFLKFADYSDFISASKKDSKIEILSEVNNMYRTLCSMLLVLSFLKLFEILTIKVPFLLSFSPYLLIILLIVLFLYSYRKQTSYIKKRINSNN